MSIEVLALEKFYGSQKALDKVGFTIDRPQVVALLGPNGAGKSTLMKILTTYIQSDGGEAYVEGFSVTEQPMEVRRKIGYLPEHNPLYLNMYVYEYLQFAAGFYGVDKQRVYEVTELTGLLPESHKKIGQLSKGYRQRVGLSAAILHNPPVLILDEPTTGLDPNQVVEIRQLIKDLSRNKIIILSTHIMQEVQRIADRVIMLDKGKLILDKPISELQNISQVVMIELDVKIEPEWFKNLKGLENVDNLGGNTWELSFNATEDVRPYIFDWAVNRGLKILRIENAHADLEKVFREKTKK
jgi:ABC-2 type transport system ATP-binding protein